MKVLFLTNWFPTKEHPNKGVFILENAKLIKEIQNVEVDIVHVDIKAGKSLLKTSLVKKEQGGLSYFHLEIKSKLWKYLFHGHVFLKSIVEKQIKSALGFSDYDLIHSNVIHPIGIVGGELAEKYGVPHVISEHWSKTSDFLSSSIYAKRAKLVYQKSKKIVVVSPFLQSQIERNINLPKSQFLEIPNIINQEFLNTNLSNTDTDKIKLVCVANWIKSKNLTKRLDLIVELAETVFKNDEKYCLEIIGEGEWLDEVKTRLIDAMGERVRLSGYMEKLDVANAIGKSDFLLHITNIETFGIVVAESHCTGTPVLASKVGALPSLIDSSNGVLVDNKIENWKKLFSGELPNFNKDEIKLAAKKRFSNSKIRESYNDLYSSIS